MRPPCCGIPLALAVTGMFQSLPLGTAMHVVAYHPPPPVTAVAGITGTMGVFGPLAYYFLGGSLIASIPPVVQVAVRGVEDIVEEVVDGSKLVVKCISYGLVVIAAISIVRVGACLLCMLTGFLSRATNSSLDSFRRRYGGRLRGGMNAGTGGLSVKELFAPPPVGARTERPGQIDPARLEVGDTFSFIYYRGERAGHRRTVTLGKKEIEGHSEPLLICQEEYKGKTVVRKY